jgi:hypothetical protein
MFIQGIALDDFGSVTIDPLMCKLTMATDAPSYFVSTNGFDLINYDD